MFSTTSIILCFTFLNFLVFVQCAPELPAEDSYGIVVTEWAIRNTVNNLFSTLSLKVLQQKLKLKQYSTIHNFFVSITLRDHDNLKKIAKLTHVDKIDNSTQVFITQLNEVLNEDNKSDEATDSVYVTILIEDFLSKLDNLKERNGLKNNTKFDLNKAIIRYFRNNENKFGNTTYFSKDLVKGNDTDDDVMSSNEFWQSSGRRIFEGKSTNINRFPFMVSVQFFKKFQCGGSIIKHDLVITSASCLQLAWNNRFFRENPAFLSVQVGSNYCERGGENIPVMEIEYHPGFNPKNLRHNLALMRLTRKLTFRKSKRHLKKIDFDRHPWPLPSNTNGIVVVGWGAKTLGNIQKINWKNELSFSTLDFYPLEECQEIYTKEFVTDRNFCAGFFSKGGGACDHDAGGPGVSSGILMGVISFGSPQCGTPDAPTVFTKLGYYTDWIEKIMKMKMVTGRQPTTERPPSYSPTLPVKTTTKRLKITPIVSGKKPLTPIPEADLLRANDKKHDFSQFFKTIFKKKKQPEKQREQQQKQIELKQRQEEERQEEEKKQEEEERQEEKERQQEDERQEKAKRQEEVVLQEKEKRQEEVVRQEKKKRQEEVVRQKKEERPEEKHWQQEEERQEEEAQQVEERQEEEAQQGEERQEEEAQQVEEPQEEEAQQGEERQEEETQQGEERQEEEAQQGEELQEEKAQQGEELQEEEAQQGEETEEVTEKEVDKTQDSKEVQKIKLKKALRNKLETEIKKEDKLSSSKTNKKSKGKEKMTWTPESQSHSEENWSDKTITTIRPFTILGSYKAKVTILHDKSDTSSAEITSYKKLIPTFKQRNDENKEASSGQEKEFDEAIDSLLDNLNINYILESKEKLSVDPQRMRKKDLKSKPNLTAMSKKKGKKPSSVVENKNLNAAEEDESNANNGVIEDEDDIEDGTNEYENNEQSSSENKSVEIADENPSADKVESYSNDNHENEHREKVVHTVNNNNEMNDYERDDSGETDEEFETLKIPAESLEQENSSSNSTDRLLDMLDYEDLYKLLAEHSN